ncbi:hypothetical protein GQ55_5G440500 [Panicum hallii var. hallii]|uniref:C2 domain-containing protein n=1 Tax=Panicum hallii var. hallii TaxID=1504633 RepID=A0A2T7DPM6_9POAL|nr:hypothetical protein GQ55_5G440500 [Panicum hallii var. hallii]
MASSYLVVHVGDANVPSSSSTTPGTSYYVELRFNGQSARTEMKENARWNHIIRFPRRERPKAHYSLAIKLNCVLVGNPSKQALYLDRENYFKKKLRERERTARRFGPCTATT